VAQIEQRHPSLTPPHGQPFAMNCTVICNYPAHPAKLIPALARSEGAGVGSYIVRMWSRRVRSEDQKRERGEMHEMPSTTVTSQSKPVRCLDLQKRGCGRLGDGVPVNICLAVSL
jgi:hypothetical protein